VVATAANVHDSQVPGDLRHGGEPRFCGESACSSQREAIRNHAPRARDVTQHKASRQRPLSALDRSRNRSKSRVRAKAQHRFLMLKRVFGFSKGRHRRLDKNANRLLVACGVVKLFHARRRLLLATQDRCDRHRSG